MPKRVNDVLNKIPKSEKICMKYSTPTKIYVITKSQNDGTYFLYVESDKGYTFKKSRKNDPCFPECC